MTSAGPPADLIVVGGGLAGLVAGARACELGLRPVIVEQGPDADYRCNSRSSGGILHIAYHDPKEDADTLVAAIRAANSDEVNRDLADSVARNGGRLIDWLGANGVKFVRASPLGWHRWAVAPPRPIRPGLDFPGRGVDTILRKLTARIVAGGGTILLGHRATAIVRLDDGAIGLSCMTAAGMVEHAGKALVIADGGFQSDPELVRRHIGPRPDLIVQRGAGNGRGDGIKMAVAMGAALTPMRHFYGHLLHRGALSNLLLWPYPMLDSIATASILVNRDGNRFADEAKGGVYLANMVAALDDPASAAIVFDQSVWEGTARQGLYPTNPHLEASGGKVFRAETVADLARQLGVDANNLARSIEAFNGAPADGADHGSPAAGAAAPIRPPYLAVPVCAGITHTMGGLAIDGRARVLGIDGAPIAGLYAAGSSTGGLEGGGTAGYVGGLTKAGITGLLAAEDIAGHVEPAARSPSAGRRAPAAARFAAPIDEYGLLRAVIRNGHLVCAMGALAAAIAGGWLGLLHSVGLAVGLAAVAAIIAYGVTRLVVETLTLIARLLMPEDG